ncbi:HCL188Wp [Eremothecium sinecaudum]|uniref:Coatomer subunit epsilon n=1 Tax=Eremothecium sinecaudum TaxID=45286 RepID=A0A109UYK1_9SACH|nr:HCL188Wp [Eremothecium sinecaudum]AMD19963.1 HCL188Wp [Eremothecium sinecaudum]
MDYFSLKQQFYTGNYKQVLSDIEKHKTDSNDTVVYYKNRSQLALNKYEKGEKSQGLDALFDSYADFLSNKKKLVAFEKVAAKIPGLYVANLLACAKAVSGDLSGAWETCTSHLDEDSGSGAAELLLTAIQVGLVSGQHRQAAGLLENFMAARDIAPEDEIIINMAESYVHFHTSQHASGSNFYLYEELCQTFPSWKTQLGLLNLQLQQGNLPEAKAVIDLLEDEFYQKMAGADTYKADLLANKVTYAVMNGEDASIFRSELGQICPAHPLIKAHEECNTKFDAIVARYTA